VPASAQGASEAISEINDLWQPRDRSQDCAATEPENPGARLALSRRLEALAWDRCRAGDAQGSGQVSPVLATRASSENAANCLAGSSSCCSNQRSNADRRGADRCLQSDFKQRIDPGFDRSLAQKVGTKRMNGTYARFFKLTKRVRQKLMRLRGTVLVLPALFDGISHTELQFTGGGIGKVTATI